MSKLNSWFLSDPEFMHYGVSDDTTPGCGIYNGSGWGEGSGNGYGNSFGFCYSSHPNDCDFSNGVSFGYGTGEGCGYKNGLVDIPFNYFRGFLDE